jgi:hypothetical protein
LANRVDDTGGTMGLSLLGGAFYNLKSKPRALKEEKNFTRSPFRDLLENGFSRNNDRVIGLINGYTTIICHSRYTGKFAINIYMLFDPRQGRHFLSDCDMQDIRTRNKLTRNLFEQDFEWSKNAVIYCFEYDFIPPAYEKILRRTKLMADVLKQEGLKQIGYQETNTLLETLLSKDP